MKLAFRLFDRDGDGFISKQEMSQALAQFGAPLNDRELDQLIAEATLGASNQLTYEIFKRVTMNGFGDK